MAKEFEIKIEGIDELVKNMLEFQKSFKGNVMAKALRKGANVIRDEARRNAPYDDTPDGIHIRDAIKVRRDSRPQLQGMNEIMYVRPYSNTKVLNRKLKKEGKKKTRKTVTRYWHVQEFGSVNVRGQRFLTRAWESKKVKALDTIIFELKKDVDKQVAKFKL
jgi:HK97 gp10 family phage protein